MLTYMGNYGAKLSKAVTSTTVALGSIQAPAAGERRIAIFDILFGSNAAGDTQFAFNINRSTTAPTGSAVTPNPLDVADPACLTEADEEITVNGTLTANVIPLSLAMNQRSTVRWVCREGKEIIIPAVADNGVHVTTPTALATPQAQVHVMFQEL